MIQTNSTTKDLAQFFIKKLNSARAKLNIPPEEILVKLFETMFYSSLKTEEAQFIKVTVTFIDPSNPDPNPPKIKVPDRWSIIPFKERMSFDVKNLVKLSKAADPWSSSLAVYFDDNNDLFIWGMIDQAIHYQTFLSYENDAGPEKPGLFQTTITGIGQLIIMFDYELIATLKQNVLITNYIDVFKNGNISEILNNFILPIKLKVYNLVKKTFPDNDIDDWSINIEAVYKESLSRILLRIQNYSHGGAILITKKIGTNLDIKHKIQYDRLHSSLLNNMKYTIENYNYYQEINDKYLETSKKNIPIHLYLDESLSEFEKRDTSSEIKGAIRYISSLSCIDGLIVLTPDLKVKGFGTVIKMKKIPETVYVSNTSRIYEDKLVQIETNHFGTRHRSMLSYCWNNPDSLGFVISQDGDIRAITRSNDKLIIWENIKVLQYLRSRKLMKPLLKRRKNGS